MVVYVDDMLLLGETEQVKAVANAVKSLWECSPLELLNEKKELRFCGMELRRYKKGVFQSQTGYLVEMLKGYEVQGVEAYPLPLDYGLSYQPGDDTDYADGQLPQTADRLVMYMPTSPILLPMGNTGQYKVLLGNGLARRCSLAALIETVNSDQPLQKLLYGDSKAALSATGLETGPWRTRHVRIRAHALREAVRRPELGWRALTRLAADEEELGQKKKVLQRDPQHKAADGGERDGRPEADKEPQKKENKRQHQLQENLKVNEHHSCRCRPQGQSDQGAQFWLR